MLLGHRSSTSLLAALEHGPRRGRRGMTLIEVMIVIVLILMVMGALAFGLQSMFAQGQGMTAELQMAKINERITIYVARKRKAPSSLSDAYNGADVPVDPWGNDFKYRVGGPDGRKYEIISYGADGKEGGTGPDADIKWSEVSPD